MITVKNNFAYVETEKGTFVGSVEENMVVFRGLPYAKAPVGKLRFCPPQPCDNSNDKIECLEFGHCAMQDTGILVNTEPDEDCLYLNIFAPKNCNEKSPVMFFIHGGGYYTGCGSMNYYDGESFADRKSTRLNSSH